MFFIANDNRDSVINIREALCINKSDKNNICVTFEQCYLMLDYDYEEDRDVDHNEIIKLARDVISSIVIDSQGSE